MHIEIEPEGDGRWIAEVKDLPGVMGYGQSREEAISKVEALALRVIADRTSYACSYRQTYGLNTKRFIRVGRS